MKLYSLLFFLFIGFCSQAQNRIPKLSSEAQISLLTIGQGPELYDSFGHTAVRVRDSKQGIDIVFNYGLFDFDTPNFYLKFAQGKLLYRLDISPFDKFIANYVAQQRSVQSQKLQQTPSQKQELFDFLYKNAQEGNNKYLYEFLYDNCATRPANAINGIYKEDIFSNYIPETEGLTHRQLIQKNVPWNTWGSFGMDIAIGSVTDRPVTNKEYLFLPEYTMKALSVATINGKPLVAPVKTMFEPVIDNSYKENVITSPLVVFSLLSLFIFYLTYRDNRKNAGITYVDKTILSITGIVGILLALLWFATDHSPTKWNYNVLWAFPFHILAAISVRKSANKRWLYPYMKLAIILLALLGFHWIIGVQSYPLVLLPLLIALAIRYLYILKNLKLTISQE